MVVQLLVGILLFLAVRNVEMHSYHSGTCPDIEPQSGFEMSKMLGIWYVLEKTNTASSCIIYNITKTDKPDEFKVEEISQHFMLALTPLKHAYRYTGILKVPDPSVPGEMIISFPLSVAGESSFTVFMTDYNTYAGIFTCQKLAFAHRQSATILSRARTLDKIYIETLRSKLASAEIDPFNLSLIKQEDCPANLTAGYIIDVRDKRSAEAVLRKAERNLGDGSKGKMNAVEKHNHNHKHKLWLP